MKPLWLLLLVPNLCSARIVQVDDLVKKDTRYAVGTVLHETASFMVKPGEASSSSGYRLSPAFRYQFAGVVREGNREYIQLSVYNLFFENLLARDQSTPHGPKGEPLPNETRTQPAPIVLMLPTENGRARFAFPQRVVGKSNAEQVPVSEAVLEAVAGRLRVVQVTAKETPTADLPWLPPREWPRKSEPVYLGGARESEPRLTPPTSP